DVAYNLHGGTTAGFLIRAAGATHRVGFAEYRYSALYNHLAPSTATLWREENLHSADQQLGLFGWTGVPVTDRPASELGRSEVDEAAIAVRLETAGSLSSRPLALVHPAAAFDTKRWAAEKFAAICDHLSERGITPILVASAAEKDLLDQVSAKCRERPEGWSDLSLPQITALARRCRIFVGNDSGVAHIATAVKLRTVVIFGSSNIEHWRPWRSVSSVVVDVGMPCAPCPGYTCGEFATPQCIERISVAQVTLAIDSVLAGSS
ncbi:MAG: glycosyltransferase family 9 protein, partial [Pyrinomonadaceae bacterium]